MKKFICSICIIVLLLCLCACGASSGPETIQPEIPEPVVGVGIFAHGDEINVTDEDTMKSISDAVSGLSFVKVKDKTIPPGTTVDMQVTFYIGGKPFYQVAMPYWKNEAGVFYCDDASPVINQLERFLSGNSSVYAENLVGEFLWGFFHVDKDGRFTQFSEIAEAGDVGEDAINAYHAGIKPFLTDEALDKIMQGRLMYKLDSACIDESKDWEYAVNFEPHESIERYYTYTATLVSGDVEKTFTGNVSVSEDGLIDSFYISGF